MLNDGGLIAIEGEGTEQPVGAVLVFYRVASIGPAIGRVVSPPYRPREWGGLSLVIYPPPPPGAYYPSVAGDETVAISWASTARTLNIKANIGRWIQVEPGVYTFVLVNGLSIVGAFEMFIK